MCFFLGGRGGMFNPLTKTPQKKTHNGRFVTPLDPVFVFQAPLVQRLSCTMRSDSLSKAEVAFPNPGGGQDPEAKPNHPRFG